MKLFVKILVSVLTISLILVVAAWTFRANIIAYSISRSLNYAPVSIEQVAYKNASFTIKDLIISNLNSYPKTTAFSAAETTIYTSLKDLIKKKVTIESIDVEDIYIHIDVYQDGSNNWSLLLADKKGAEKSSTPYLIEELTLRNLAVSVTDASGKTIHYPVIKEMVFYNISDETGFPIHEVEKAIFQLVLRKLFQDFGIKTIEDVLKNVIPKGIPFFGS